MTNDECRMSNEIRMSNAQKECCNPATPPLRRLGIRHAFVIRISTLVLVAFLQTAFVGAQAVDAAAAKKAEEDARVQQYVQMLQPTLWAELDFIRLTCSNMPVEKRPSVKTAGEEALKQAARDISMPRQQRGRQVTQTSAAITIRAKLLESLKSALPEEEYARFSEEAAKRIAYRKEATILSVVSRLDGLLCLSADRREKMVEALTAAWQDDWEQWLMLHHYGDNYFPQVPDQHIIEFLNEEQRTVWKGVQKISVNSWGGEGRARDSDDWWEGKK